MPMRLIPPLLLTSLLALTGCAASTPETAEDIAAPTPTPTPNVACLTVTPQTIEGLQWGLDQKQEGFTVDDAVAIVTPVQDDMWLVAGKFSGPGVEDAVGVWATIQDPTSGSSMAFMSVDAIATEFSDYMRPADWSAAMPGVTEVTDCLP